MTHSIRYKKPWVTLLMLSCLVCPLIGEPVDVSIAPVPNDTPAYEVSPTSAAYTVTLVPLDPKIMPEPGVYGGWGQGDVGPDGKFYFAIGNHLTTPAADAWLIAYDPETRRMERVMSSRETDGWHHRNAELGDGKLHTAVDIAPDGTTYLLSFYGDYPNKSDWDSGYPGGRLFKHNIYRGDSQSLGVPFAGDSWPMQRWDHQRGVLVGVGERGLYLNPQLGENQTPSGTVWEGPDNEHSYGSLLVYETDTQTIRYVGLPEELDPDLETPLRLERRSLALDPNTGRFFGSSTGSPAELILIDPAEMSRHQSKWIRPTGLMTDSPIRAATRQTNHRGELILASRTGMLYALSANQLTLRELGPAWTPGIWLTDLSLSNDGRYVYYVVDSTWTGRAWGVPVVQYDLEKHARTVICFLDPLLYRDHGYVPVGAYTAVLNPANDRLFIQVNGSYTDDPQDAKYEQPILVDIKIPEALRHSP